MKLRTHLIFKVVAFFFAIVFFFSARRDA